MVLLTPVPSFVPKNAHLEFYQLYNGTCVHFLPLASPKFCSCIQKQTLAIKTSEVDQNLWTATDVKTKGRWRCLKLFTRSHPLGVPWHWNDLRVLHEACLTADYTDRPATATNTQMHQDAQTKSTKTGTHTITRCMDVSTTHACADEHTRASYWKPTLLDCFNSFSFDWWKVVFLFSKYHRCSCLQQLYCSLEEEWVAVHHFQQQIEFQQVAWCVFGWWSISRSCIFRLMQVLQVTDWLPV